MLTSDFSAGMSSQWPGYWGMPLKDQMCIRDRYREMLDTMDGMGLPDIEKKTDQKMQECSQRMQRDACNGE